MFDVCSLLAVNCGAFGVMVEVSTIFENSVGCGVISCRPFGAGEIVSEILQWEISLLKPYNASATSQNFCGGIMSITADEFSTKTFSDCKSKQRSTLVVQARFCWMQVLTIVSTSWRQNHGDSTSFAAPWKQIFLCKCLPLVARPILKNIAQLKKETKHLRRRREVVWTFWF